MEINNYSDIGLLLKRAREERQLSMEQLSQALHIRLRYVEALEQGRLSDMPGLIYTKGYLQAYAAYVGLDKDEILRRFEQVEGLFVKRGFYFPQVFHKDKKPGRLAVWGGLAAALLVYVFWLAVLQPPEAAISVVEHFPKENAVKAPVSMRAPADAACFHSQAVYYPPCTMAWARLFSLMPQIRPDKAPRRPNRYFKPG